MNENKKIRWILVAMGVVMLFSALFSLPVWQSTMHHDLMAQRHQLESKLNRLHDRELLLSVQSHTLASRNVLEKMAIEKMGLTYEKFPIVVRVD